MKAERISNGRPAAVRARRRLSEAVIHDNFTEVPQPFSIKRDALPDEVQLFVLYDHPSGFFAQAQVVWTTQQSQGYEGGLDENLSSEPPADFWQFNVFGGYRFRNNRGEISLGVLDLNNKNYQLNPLNALCTPIDFYDTIATKRTLLVRVRFNF